MLRKDFISYFDMDGVLNLFESDTNARQNMWNPGYFINIPVRDGISDLLERINYESHVIILSKYISRVGVIKEKDIWVENNLSKNAYSGIIYVPYDRSKSEYISTTYPSMIVDDNEKNIDECSIKGSCSGIFFSDIKTSKKYPNAKDLEDIWQFYCNLTRNL